MFKKILATGLGVLLSLNAFAEDLIFRQEFPLIWSSIITISGGPAWTSPGQNQFLYTNLPALQVSQYKPNSDNDLLATGEIFFGLQRPLQPWLVGELGLGIAAATDAELSGSIIVDGVPGIGTYQYKVNHGRLELKGKLIANSFTIFHPYISGSFGAARNTSHDFRALSTDPLFFYAPWFSTQTSLSFPYTLGIGVQSLISPNWQVGVGYEFADLGKSYLGVDATTLIAGPSLTHLYTNQLLFSLSYLFAG